MTTTPVDGSGDSIENLGHENRHFPPSAEFAAQANAKADIYATADADRLAFWESQARELTWDQPWSTVLDWQVPYANGLLVENSMHLSTHLIAMSQPVAEIELLSTLKASQVIPARLHMQIY
jgi:hypothetical protein